MKARIELQVSSETDLSIRDIVDLMHDALDSSHGIKITGIVVDKNEPLSAQFKEFHFSTEENGKHSVNMQREDAKTVSMSHISVNTQRAIGSHRFTPCKICFEYFDNVLKETHIVSNNKENSTELA